MNFDIKLLFLTIIWTISFTNAGDLPTNFNLAYGRRIEASSTCGVGVSERELFCKLTGANPDRTDDSFSQVIQGQLCDFCDPTDPRRSHPPEFAIDGSEKWWQSPPLSRGSHFNEVNLTIHMDQEFYVAYVYMRMGNSPRPGVFILERSTDFGKTWKPWQYFADTRANCHRFFGHLGYDEYIMRDDSVICTTEYSKVTPLEGGEIIVSLVNLRPSANNFSYSDSLQDWTRATDIRFRFLKTNTLLGHLMAVAQSDITVTRRYYYSIKDISIGGQCVCNGHAKYCDKQDVRQPNRLICQCQHNTCGDHCEKCCPGYIQKPWRPATHESHNECEPCQCHGHSNECIYDEEIARNRTSLDIHGNYEGGGVCLNCQHNTEGINCQKCRHGYFKSKRVHMNSPHICERCRCDTRYSTGDCDDETGVCECRPEYAAPDCKSCSVGYYGYPHCKPCRCHVNGTKGQVCDSGAGGCPCKYNYAGPNCNYCAPDFYDFPSCKPCDCDSLGSQNTRCDPRTGQCICNPRFGGRKCDECANGLFGYPNCHYCSCESTGSTDEVCDKDTGRCLCKENYTGERCNRCLDGFHRFPYCLPCGCNENGVEANICQDNGQCLCKVNFVGKTCNQCAPGYYNYPDCIPCECSVEGSQDRSCDQTTGQCYCNGNFQGVKCDECRPNYYNYPRCEECTCDPRGAQEIAGHPLGGCGLHEDGRLCLCKERVAGRLCDTCAPSFWNLSFDNPDGCEECACDTRGTLGLGRNCDPFTGQCVCKPFVGERRCDKCIAGTYNFQEHNAFGCQPCNCNVGGSLDSTCDETGQCKCKPRVQGKKCDSPIPIHYYPNLHHLKYELEDGRTEAGGPVRYDYGSANFPGYSWKGYAVFSKLQDKVLYDADIEKPGLYKLLYRYINREEKQTAAQVTLTPDYIQPEATEQSSNVVFSPSYEPSYTFASSGAGVISTFFLNAGKWTFKLETTEDVNVDYMILVPSDYYEASVLHNKFYLPCTLPPTDNICKHYVYVGLDFYNRVEASDGRTMIGSGFEQTQLYDNQDILDKLGVGSMAKLDDSQTSLTIDVPLKMSGDYAFLVSYFTKDSPRTQELEVNVVGAAEGDQAVLRLPNCPYTSPCRQYVQDPSHSTKYFPITSNYATLTLTGRSDVDLAIESIYAIPKTLATPFLLEPKFKCIYRNEKCATGLPTISLPGVKIHFKSDDVNNKPPSFPTISSNNEMVHLHRSHPQTDIQAQISRPDDYKLVTLYYQPYISAFDVDVYVHHRGQVHKGVLKADFCPSTSGCHSEVVFRDGPSIRLIDPNVRITFNSSSPVWLDYAVIVPSSSFHDKIIEDNTGSDVSNEFIEQCAGDHFDVNDKASSFCKESVYSLVTEYNNGALECSCDAEGSADPECEKYGGQCRCKANIIGRTCSQCSTGYWGFPECKKCDCKHRLCDPIDGKCVCPPKVTGADCDECAPQTFGFDPVIGCEDCNCHPDGVDRDTDCDKLTGECGCKENVGGRKCDQCQTGHYDFPICNACSCDPKGVTDNVCDQATSQCLCKENVEGSYCDKCKDSTFFLEQRNPMGCSKCFCFGVTTHCQSSSLRWNSVSDYEGWELTNVLESEIERDGNKLTVNDHQLIQSKVPVYWVAPSTYIGNKIVSYGGELSYVVYTEKDYDAEALLKPDVILEGGEMRISYAHELLVNAGEKYEAKVDLIESKFVHEATGSQVSREQFMTVLSKLETLLIRATYYTHTTVFSIEDVNLKVAQDRGDELASTVEMCQCPPNYSGTSCETCAEGFYREQGSSMGPCVPCNCNNRARSCHPLTGACLDCRDNFDGPQCMTCKQGHYHDLHYDVCRPCNCPHGDPDRNFASTCEVNHLGTLERCYCLPGYMGQFCDRCAPGYWGDPLVEGGSCKKCECNDNIDDRDPGACDQATGKCLRCLGSTQGDHCERCSDGFFGDAIVLKNCQRCACDYVGTDHCEHNTGKCVCKPNVHGPTCSQCVSGAFGFHSDHGCEMCECGAASLTNMCDTVSGQCECRTGVQGRKCDQCQQGYWNYGPRGCQKCECLSKGAIGCDPQTGACRCLSGVTGPNCDRCQPKWVMIEGSGCRECDSCIHLLVDDIEILDNNVTAMREELENITIGVQAFKKLDMVNMSLIELNPKIDKLIAVDAKTDKLDKLGDDLSQVQALTVTVLTKSEQVSRQCEGVSGDAVDIKKKANSLYDDILQKAQHDVNEAISFVKTILATITGSNNDVARIERLVNQADDMLESIKKVSLDTEHKEASDEMNRAAETLQRAKDLLESASKQANNTQEIRTEIEEVLSKLLDLQNHTKISMEKATEVSELNNLVNSTKNHISKMVGVINDRKTEFSKCMDETEELLKKSAQHIQEAKGSLSGIETEIFDLEKALNDVDSFSNELTDENTKLKDIVSKALEHANMLEKQSMDVQNLLKNTKSSSEAALRASEAYEKIVKAIEDALKAYETALEAAKTAHDLSDGLAEQVVESKEKSEKLREGTADVYHKIQSDVKRKLDKISLMLHDIKQVVIKENVTEVLTGVEEIRTKGLGDQAQNASRVAKEYLETAKEIQMKLKQHENSTKEDSEKLKSLPEKIREMNSKIKNAQGSLAELSSLVPQSDDLIQNLLSQADILSQLQSTLKNNIDSLRNQIRVARDTANLVNVGVNLTDDSYLQVRNIKEMNSAGLTSNIGIDFKTSSPNGLIYYLGNHKDEYISLGVQDGHLVAKVNTGSGESEIKSKNKFDDDQWYYTKLSRSASKLVLEVLKDDNEVEKVEGKVDSEKQIMTFDLDTEFYVGGVPDVHRDAVDQTLDHTRFTGSLDGLTFQNNKIGLWNFVRGRGINGSKKKSEKAVNREEVCFNGEGYAVLENKRGNENSSKTSLSFEAKTFQKDALLLLFTGEDFLSFDMVDGKLRVMYDLGSGNVTFLSKDNFNDGEWFDVSFRRKEQKSMVLARKVSLGRKRSFGLQLTLEIDHLVHVGGFKGKHNISSLSHVPFKGKMRNLKWETNSLNIYDNIEAVGISAVCSESSSLVSFAPGSSNAYVQVPNPYRSFDKPLEISFKFRTNQSDAFIFYTTDKDQDTSLSVGIREKNLVFVVSVDQNYKDFVSVEQVDDAKWHYVQIKETDDGFKCFLDESEVLEVKTEKKLDRKVLEELYIGQYPSHKSLVFDNVAKPDQFIGCIGDFSVNSEQIDFAAIPAEDRVSVTPSSCFFKEMIPLQPPSHPQHHPSSHQPSHSNQPSHAKQPSYHTHSSQLPGHGKKCNIPMDLGETYLFQGRDPSYLTQHDIRFKNQENNNYHFEFKSGHNSNTGLIYYINSHTYHDFLAVYMINGQIALSFNCGTGKAKLTTLHRYDDQQWHSIDLIRKRQIATITMDSNQEQVRVEAPGNATGLEVSPPHYLGGWQVDYVPNVDDELRNLPSFDGYMRNVRVDDMPFTHDREVNVIFSNGFSKEPGFFFPDQETVAVIADQYDIPANMDISIGLKSMVENAVLLSVHNPSTHDYLVLQMVDGDLHFSVRSGADEIYVYFPLPTKLELCDGVWHTIQARKIKNVLSLRVDSMEERYASGIEKTFSSSTGSPLFFGGVLEHHPGLRTGQSYAGCIQNIYINSSPISLEHIRVLRGKKEDYCPSS